jgi:hypothetical protein
MKVRTYFELNKTAGVWIPGDPPTEGFERTLKEWARNNVKEALRVAAREADPILIESERAGGWAVAVNLLEAGDLIIPLKELLDGVELGAHDLEEIARLVEILNGAAERLGLFRKSAITGSRP